MKKSELIQMIREELRTLNEANDSLATRVGRVIRAMNKGYWSYEMDDILELYEKWDETEENQYLESILELITDQVRSLLRKHDIKSNKLLKLIKYTEKNVKALMKGK